MGQVGLQVVSLIFLHPYTPPIAVPLPTLSQSRTFLPCPLPLLPLPYRPPPFIHEVHLHAQYSVHHILSSCILSSHALILFQLLPRSPCVARILVEIPSQEIRLRPYHISFAHSIDYFLGKYASYLVQGELTSIIIFKT